MQARFNLDREQKNALDFGFHKNPAFGVNFHSQIEIQLVLRGQMEILLGEESRRLGEGDIVICFSYDAHGFRSEEGTEGFYLILPTHLLSEYAQIPDGCGRGRVLSDPETFSLCRDLAMRLSACDSEIARRGYALAILGEILAKLPAERHSAQSKEASLPREIMIYINEHYKEDLSLPSLAAKWGYHPSYFSRLFRQTFGISFCKYLAALRLRECVLRLESGEGNVTLCALESGFGSVRSFYRVFEESFGCSPRE